MAQACEKYTCVSLMGNWYQQRYAPQQKFRIQSEKRVYYYYQLRQKESAISYPSQNGKLALVQRVVRHYPWNTQGVIHNDRSKEYNSIMKTSYDIKNLNNFQNINGQRPLIKHMKQKNIYPINNPHSLQTKQSEKICQITKNNMNELNVQRKVRQVPTNFYSPLPKHQIDHNKFYPQTIYTTFYGNLEKKPVNQYLMETKNSSKNKQFYLTNKINRKQGLFLHSPLVGENYKQSCEPKANNQIQRIWNMKKDNAIKEAKKNIITNLNKNKETGFMSVNLLQNYTKNLNQQLNKDIMTSLNIEKGVWNLKPNQLNPGYFRRIRSDITLKNFKPLTKK